MAVILAGGEGERLSILSQERAKPAVPFGGKYRIIDFTLSNCVNSDIDDVVVLTQYNPRSLNDHIGLGRPWDLDRNRGGARGRGAAADDGHVEPGGGRVGAPAAGVEEQEAGEPHVRRDEQPLAGRGELGERGGSARVQGGRAGGPQHDREGEDPQREPAAGIGEPEEAEPEDLDGEEDCERDQRYELLATLAVLDAG